MRAPKPAAALRRPPQPHVEIELQGTVPVLVFRGCAVAVAALGAVALDTGPVIPVLAAVLVAAWSHPGVVALLTGLAAYRLLQLEPALATTAALVLSLHLLLVLTRLAARLPARGWVEGRLLRAMLVPFLLVQAASQALAALAIAATTAMPTIPWLAVVVVLGLIALVLLARRWATRPVGSTQ